MPPQFHHRTTKKEPRCSPRPTAALEERTEEIMDRVQKAGDNHVERVAAPEEYLTLTRAHEGETWFDAGAWTEDLAGSYLALGRVDDAVRTISNTTRSGCAEGTEMLCELAEKLTRSGHEPQARPLWQQARADYPGDVWIYVQAGIGYGDIGDHAGALEWLTTGLELALRTGDPESALEQPPSNSSTSCPSGAPSCIEPAINPRRPWAREWEAPGSEFLPWYAWHA